MRRRTHEELDLQTRNIDSTYETVVEDDNWALCHPLSEEGLVYLASGTSGLAPGRGGGAKHDGTDADEIDDESRRLTRWNSQYIFIPKGNTTSKKPKKFILEKGYSDIFSWTDARYSAATWIYENCSEEIGKYFLKNNFAYINAYLKPKVGSALISNKHIYVYPQEADPGWSGRKSANNITEIRIKPGTESLNDLGGFTNVKKIIIPEGVKRINAYCFGGSANLEEVILPSTLTSIGKCAFYNCPKLKNIFIPKNVKTIGEDAFELDTWGMRHHSVNSGRPSDTPEQTDEKNKYFERIQNEYTISCEASSKPKGFKDNGDSLGPTGKYSIEPYTWFDGTGHTRRDNHYKDINVYRKVSWGQQPPSNTKQVKEELSFKDSSFTFLKGYQLTSNQVSRLILDEHLPENDINALFYKCVQDYVKDNDGTFYLFKYTNIDGLGKTYAEKHPYMVAYQSFNSDFLGNMFDATKGVCVGSICVKTFEALNITDEIPTIGLGDDLDEELSILTKELGKPKVLYSDDVWEVAVPTTGSSMLTLSKGTDGDYESELDRRNNSDYDYEHVDSEDQKFKNCSGNNFLIYVFTNKITGDKGAYSPNSFRIPGTDGGYAYIHDKTGAEVLFDRGRYSNGADALDSFLHHIEGVTIGLKQGCVKKWPQGLHTLSCEIEAEKMGKDNQTVKYLSDTGDGMRAASSWNSERTNTINYLLKTKYIKNIKFPSNIKTIKEDSFSNFSAVETLNIPNSVVKIENNAFADMYSLKNIKLPEGLQEIGRYAFLRCYSLKSIIIPASVKKIDEYAFAYCKDATSSNEGIITVYCEADSKPDGWSEKGDSLMQQHHRLDSELKVNVVGGYRHNNVEEELSIQEPKKASAVKEGEVLPLESVYIVVEELSNGYREEFKSETGDDADFTEYINQEIGEVNELLDKDDLCIYSSGSGPQYEFDYIVRTGGSEIVIKSEYGRRFEHDIPLEVYNKLIDRGVLDEEHVEYDKEYLEKI